MLTIICSVAIGVLLMNIKMIQKNPYLGIRISCTLLFSLSTMRYITLLLFSKTPTVDLMSKLQGFYFITIIGMGIPLLLLMWYITPLYREMIKPLGMVLICMPYMMLYGTIVILKPFKVMKDQTAGYLIRTTGNWSLYLATIQILFMTTYIILALCGFSLYKHKQTRSQYLVLIMCQLLFLVDGLTYFSLGTPSIPVFTLTEVFGFVGIYYGFSKPTIDARGIKHKKG